MQALQASTLNAGKYLGLADTGTVEGGKRADLVLLNANPLADIKNTRKIEAVFLAGRYFSRADLDRLLAGVEEESARSK
jgi:imidazolonepropionase-like amidohydrolase